MTWVVPGYVHETVPVPQARHGEVVPEAEVKKFWQTPRAQTWSTVHGLPQTAPVEQNSGLEAS